MASHPPFDPTASAPDRHAVIDWLRCAAIVAVVCHHSGPPAMHSETERFVRSVLVMFDVPVFLFASGFLYFRPGPIGLHEVGRRLKRVLIPYLVASCLVWVVDLHPQTGLRDMAFRLITGGALGIYYYVFLITVSIPLIWPLSRLRRGQVAALAACAHLYPIVAKLVPVLGLKLGMFGGLRNPLNYGWAYFLTGWVVAAWLPEIRRLRDEHPRILWIVGLTGIALWFINGSRWLGVPFVTNGRAVYSLCIVLVAALALGGRTAPRAVLFVSQASYTVYLYHLFVVGPLRFVFGRWDWWISVPLFTLIGVAAPLAVAWLARRLLGERSRTWFG